MKKILLFTTAALLLVVAVIQFIPAPPLVVPAELPAAQRAEHRLLNFEAIANFRDLGGYPAADGRQVRWGTLYRAGTLAHATDADLAGLGALQLDTLIDFRSTPEKEEEPNRLPEPPGFTVLEIPTLDEGNEAMIGEIMARIENNDFDGFDPDALMLEGNRQFASTFTPQFRRFMQAVLAAEGAPVLWHCSAGKDRTGFAAAILLRVLGVPEEVVFADYMASEEHALRARRGQLLLLRVFKGDEAADKLAVMMGVRRAWLQAAFDQIDRDWGDFDTYVREALQLSEEDIARLRANLLS